MMLAVLCWVLDLLQLQWLIVDVTIMCMLKHVTTAHAYNHAKTTSRLPVIVLLLLVAATLVIAFLVPKCNLLPCHCLAVAARPASLSLFGLPPCLIYILIKKNPLQNNYPGYGPDNI